MFVTNTSGLAKGDIVWVVNPQGAPLRDDPDVKSTPREMARFGARLRVIETSPAAPGVEQWLQVNTDDGQPFWIMRGPDEAPYVSTEQPQETYDVLVRDWPSGSLPPDGLPVRSERSLDAAVVDHVKLSERLKVFVSGSDNMTEGGVWYGVETPRKQVGWVLDKYDGSLYRIESPPASHDEKPNFEQISKAAQPKQPVELIGAAVPDHIEPPGLDKRNEPDYGFRLDVIDGPDKAVPDEWIEFHIRLQNRGKQRWVLSLNSPIGGQPVEVAYRITPKGGLSIVAEERLPLDEDVEVGGETMLTRTLTAPESPGDYLVIWDMVHLLTGEMFSAHAEGAPKPISLHVLDRTGVLRALEQPPPTDVAQRAELIATMGDLLLRPIDLLEQQHLVSALISAVFDTSTRVSRTAADGLFAALARVPDIELQLTKEIAAQPIEVRARLRKNSYRNEVRDWLTPLLLLKSSTAQDKTAQPEKPIGPETTPQTDRTETPLAPSTGQPSTTQINITPPSQYYARPPDERKITVTVMKEAVRLKCGNYEYASANRLDYEELAARRSSAETYGHLLFDGLFNADKLMPSEATLVGYNKHASNEKGVIFELEIAPGETKLQTLKWEYMLPPGNVPPLAVFKKSPFFRHMGGQPPKDPPGWPLKVLAAVCSPSTLGLPLDADGYPVDKDGNTANRHLVGLKPIDVSQERTILTDALERVKEFGAVEYTVLDGSKKPVTLAAIRQALQDGDFHVLHIVAHGVLVDDEQFHLVLASEDGREDLVPVNQFDAPRFGNLRLVVLSTCQSATLALKGALHGLAPRLIEIGVPAVVAMQDLVQVPTAQRFTQWFYHHLARSGRIDMAMAATRLQLYDIDHHSRQWGIPVLFMSSDDGRVFEVSDEQVQQHGMPDQIDVKERDFPSTRADEEALSRYLASQAAQLGASPALVGAYRSLATQPPSQPLLDPQNRAYLTRRITTRVDIKAAALQDFVTQNGGDRRLQLGAEVFARIASALNAGKHIILIGPPGTGKTTLAQRICEFAENVRHCAGGVAVTTATADWTTFDTVGGYVPTQQQTLEFRPGAFLRAIRDGQWLIIDEINRAEIDKAFGELFTLLSGQGVDLPYTVNGQPVRVRPPKSTDPLDWVPDDLAGRVDDYDFVVHPTWRIIGTMNVYDKSYLFAMSFAFMRRFAFIDCDLPSVLDDLGPDKKPRDLFAELIDDWLKEEQIQAGPLQAKLNQLIARDTALMKRRALGPAIIRDMLFFIKDRRGDEQVKADSVSDLSLLGEAILLYAVPQLDGLDRQDILDIYQYLGGFLVSLADDKALNKVRNGVLDRIRLVYPHIRPDEWKKALA